MLLSNILCGSYFKKLKKNNIIVVDIPCIDYFRFEQTLVLEINKYYYYLRLESK